ncbi:MAG: zinc ribbon domain-containing protein [Candidatus Bathyarchaeota archaeon]|nr:zinc ribbon domain-containing protein [Candidatus Bathyarchaeota archaeon]
MPYCGNCGAEIIPNTNFCGKCGAAVASASMMPPPPPPPPPTQVPSNTAVTTFPQASGLENALGVMLLRKPKSLGRYDSYTGVVTTHRLIFAQMTSEMLKDAVKTARDQAKAEGKGFWDQWSDQMKASFSYSQKYLTMAPSAILAETQGNFAISNDAIREIKVKLQHIRQGQPSLHEFELEIHSAAGKYEFRMDERDDYVKLLKQAYGERVKTPFGYFSSHGVKIHL